MQKMTVPKGSQVGGSRDCYRMSQEKTAGRRDICVVHPKNMHGPVRDLSEKDCSTTNGLQHQRTPQMPSRAQTMALVF